MSKRLIFWVCFVLVLAIAAPVFGDDILAPGDFIIAIDADGGSSSPDAEQVPEAIDQIYGGAGQKYLNFGKENSGFIVTPTGGPSIINSLTIWTANDNDPRDPATWALYGTNSPILSTNHSTGTAESWTLIDSGSINLPAGRNTTDTGPTGYNATASVTSTQTYTSYKMLFPTLKNTTNANSMQFAEIQFYGAFSSPAAYGPDPYDDEINVSVDTNLTWIRGDYAAQEYVYFGTDPCALPQVATLLSFQPAEYDPGDPNIVASTTYYWWINTQDANGIWHPSDLWSFSTISGKAMFDFPADGSVIPGNEYGGNIYTWLDFIPGATAVDFRGYASDNYAEVFNRVEDANLGPPPYPTMPNRYYIGLPVVFPYVESLERGKVYHWAIDGFDAKGNVFPSDIWSFGIQGVKAFAPTPPNEAIFILTDVVLTWLAGYGPPPGFPPGTALEHDVYLGTDWDDVNDADTSDTTGIYKGIRSEPNFSAVGLDGGADIYWRVDEVWGRLPPPLGGGHYYKGDVWHFTTVPPGVGSVTMDLWFNLSTGSDPAEYQRSVSTLTSHPNFPGNPDQSSELTLFDSGIGLGDHYGGMIHGYLHPSISGDYKFWIASDDHSELWLSTDDSPANRQLISWVAGWSGAYVWDDTDEDNQESAPIYLEAGKKYYIRALWKEGGGGDHCHVAWQGPDQPLSFVNGDTFPIIPGSRLEPFIQLWAHSPYPSDLDYNIPSPVTLRWGEGKYADKHDVYISTDKALVDSRNIAAYQGRRDPNTSLPIALQTGKLYYWAIDEVNLAGPDPCVWEGETWIFRAQGGAGGLLAAYYHWDGVLPPVIPGNVPPDPGPYDPFQDFVLSRIEPAPNYNWGNASPIPGVVNDDYFAIKWIGHIECPIDANYTFYTQTDDGSRVFIDGVQILPEAAWQQQGMTWWQGDIVLTAGLHDIEFHFEEGWGGAGARLNWSATPTNPSDAPIPREVPPPIWLWPPLFASSPKPYDGEVIDDRKPALEWLAGVNAQTHDVFFSSVFSDVNERKASARVTLPNPADPCYPYPVLKAPLDLNTEYFWLVDEYAGAQSWMARSVWSFRTSECVAIDNMEDYNDRRDMRTVWTDGYANTVWMAAPPYSNIQGGSSGSNLNTSSAIGDPAGGSGPIHGGTQAMALYYDNDGNTFPPIPGEEKWAYQAPFFSEIEANTVENLDLKEDWAGEGVKALQIWHNGHPPADGSFSFVAENAPLGIYRYTINGRGRDIWGRHDEFYFLGFYPFDNPVGGSFIQARVIQMDNTNADAKAGLMMREKMTPYAKYAAVFVTPGNQVVFQWRASEGGPTASVAESGLGTPRELKLERVGTGAFKAWYRRGGIWEDVNDTSTGNPAFVDIPDMNSRTHVGMAVTSHNADMLCSADFNNLSVSPLPPWGFIGNVGLNSPEQLYVALKDGKGTVSVVNHPDPNAALATTWQEWNIELTDFGPSLDFNSIKKVYFGLGDRDSHPTAGGSGIVYLDDVRACPPRCVPSEAKPLADIAQPYDCEVGEEDVALLVGDWLLADEYITSVAPNALNLVARYEFENNYLDTGPYGYHASDPCGTNPGFAAGAIGTWAIELDGVSQHLVVDSNVGIDSNEPRTISGWAKANVPVDQITNWTNVFGFSSDPYPALGGRSFDINRRGGQDFYCIHVYGWEQNIITLDQDWHHLAGTYDGTTIVWYGDGIRVGSEARQINTDDTVRIGKRAHNAGGFWPGRVDEFRIYSYALSDAEIAYLATDGGAGIHIPIVSPANLYNNEPQGQQWINFRDWSVLAGSWLEKVVWP